MRITRTLRSALSSLSDGSKQPYELYAPMFPDGKFNTQRDAGSSKGGPSRMECAVNWYLGKHARSMVERETIYNDKGKAVAQGAYSLTEYGRELLLSVERGS